MADSPGQVARNLHSAFTSGDMEAALNIFSDDAVWHTAGGSPISGDYRGKGGVREFFGKLAELSDGTFVPELHDIAASEEHAVFLGIARGTRGEKTMNTPDSVVFHVKDGKITEAWQQGFNQREMDDFWS